MGQIKCPYIATLLLIVGLIFLSACGGSSEYPTPAPTQPPSDYSEPVERDMPSYPYLPLYPYLVEPIIVCYGGAWPLNGLLTIPHEASSDNPVPAAVLVQGSGDIAAWIQGRN